MNTNLHFVRMLTVFVTLVIVIPWFGRLALGQDGKVLNVAIGVWPGVELLDFAGPGEVFSAARAKDGRHFRVFTVSKSKETIRSQGFVDITPNYSLSDAPKIDILVLPGGGVQNMANDAEFMKSLDKRIAESKVTLTVCTGVYFLGKLGHLDNKRATTWHGAIDRMQRAFPKVTFERDVGFIDNEKTITSAGVSAGIDASLYLVGKLYGKETIKQAVDYMEYTYHPIENK